MIRFSVNRCFFIFSNYAASHQIARQFQISFEMKQINRVEVFQKNEQLFNAKYMAARGASKHA